MIEVKICGVTTLGDALSCVDLGANAIGVNLIASSPRCVSVERAREIARGIGGRARVVGVVADRSVQELLELRRETGLSWLQLHGDEPPDALVPLLPNAYKAVRIATEADVRAAEAYAGEYLLVDAKVQGALGGTGRTFDWGLVTELARSRKLVLAGGLTPENVGAAVRAVRPACVDVASGVERSPGVKEPSLVRAFIEAARGG